MVFGPTNVRPPSAAPLPADGNQHCPSSPHVIVSPSPTTQNRCSPRQRRQAPLGMVLPVFTKQAGKPMFATSFQPAAASPRSISRQHSSIDSYGPPRPLSAKWRPKPPPSPRPAEVVGTPATPRPPNSDRQPKEKRHIDKLPSEFTAICQMLRDMEDNNFLKYKPLNIKCVYNESVRSMDEQEHRADVVSARATTERENFLRKKDTTNSAAQKHVWRFGKVAHQPQTTNGGVANSTQRRKTGKDYSLFSTLSAKDELFQLGSNNKFNVAQLGNVDGNAFVVQEQQWLKRRGFSTKGSSVCFKTKESKACFVLPSPTRPKSCRMLLVGSIEKNVSANARRRAKQSTVVHKGKDGKTSSVSKLPVTLTTMNEALLRREQRCRHTASGVTTASMYRQPQLKQTPKVVDPELLDAAEELLTNTVELDAAFGDTTRSVDLDKIRELVEGTIMDDEEEQLQLGVLPQEMQTMLNERFMRECEPIRQMKDSAQVEIVESEMEEEGFVLYQQCEFTPEYVLLYTVNEFCDSPHEAVAAVPPREVTVQFHLPIREIRNDIGKFAVNKRQVLLLKSLPEHLQTPRNLIDLMNSLPGSILSIDVTEEETDRVYYRHSVQL